MRIKLQPSSGRRSCDTDWTLRRPTCSSLGRLACAGLRRWAEAESSAREALAVAYSTSDGHAQQLAIAQLSRILSQQGRQLEALDLEPPLLRAPLPSAQAELVFTRALALASLGQTERAQEIAQSVRGLSRAVEPAVLACATDAVCALKTHDADAIERVLELEQVAFTRGALDLLVTTYRSVPEVLSVLLHASARAGSPAWPGPTRWRSGPCRVPWSSHDRNGRPSGTALSARARSL